MWFDYICLTYSNVELESWLEHKLHVFTFSTVRTSHTKKPRNTEILKTSHVSVSNLITFTKRLKTNFQDLYEFSVAAKPCRTRVVTPSRVFSCLNASQEGEVLLSSMSSNQVAVQQRKSPRNCENLMSKKVPTRLHSDEACGLERQRTAAPLNERMPTMCGCAQAFGAGMCWKAGSVFFPPTAFPGVTWKGKQQKHRTEMDRPHEKEEKKEEGVWL